jgi:hypothetical protein
LVDLPAAAGDVRDQPVRGPDDRHGGRSVHRDGATGSRDLTSGSFADAQGPVPW